VLYEVFSVVSDLSPHVVDEEGLGEIVFIVGEWHGLEVKSHHSASFNITELVAASGGAAVSVEELSNWSAVLGEIWVLAALIPLLIIVKNVVGSGSEKLIELLILEDLIEDPDFIDSGFSTLISDAGHCNE